jgi:hypothetical protein
MDAFSQAIAVVMAICFGIFAVAIFFTILSYLNDFLRGKGREVLVAQTFIKKDAKVTVHLDRGEALADVKFIGFTQSQNPAKNPMPHNFLRMAVFENGNGERIFIPSAHIKFIKEMSAYLQHRQLNQHR